MSTQNQNMPKYVAPTLPVETAEKISRILNEVADYGTTALPHKDCIYALMEFEAALQEVQVAVPA